MLLSGYKKISCVALLAAIQLVCPPVAFSAGVVEVSVGGDESAAVKFSIEELPIPAYELPLASSIAVASISI